MYPCHRLLSVISSSYFHPQVILWSYLFSYLLPLSYPFCLSFLTWNPAIISYWSSFLSWLSHFSSYHTETKVTRSKKLNQLIFSSPLKSFDIFLLLLEENLNSFSQSAGTWEMSPLLLHCLWTLALTVPSAWNGFSQFTVWVAHCHSQVRRSDSSTEWVSLLLDLTGTLLSTADLIATFVFSFTR